MSDANLNTEGSHRATDVNMIIMVLSIIFILTSLIIILLLYYDNDEGSQCDDDYCHCCYHDFYCYHNIGILSTVAIAAASILLTALSLL